jgi:hypothetical protein
MIMPIKYTDATGKTLVAHIAPGVTPAQAAQAMGLAAGTWQEITAEQAAVLQQPTPEELAAQRRAEILARLAVIDQESIRPLRAAANSESTDFDVDKLAALDAEAAGLRLELSGLMA